MVELFNIRAVFTICFNRQYGQKLLLFAWSKLYFCLSFCWQIVATSGELGELLAIRMIGVIQLFATGLENAELREYCLVTGYINCFNKH